MKTNKYISKLAKTIAEKSLKREANRTTSAALFQPKAPISLNRFKSNQK